MKSTVQFIEALESRIAPAILVNGGNLLGGKGNPTTGETSSGGNTVTLVKVLSGEALVFFNGGITEISVGKHTKLDITGDISGDIVTNLGPDGRLTDSDGNPANGEDGGILLATGFKGLTTHPLGNELGSVGRIIAGGSVANVNVAGSLSGIYAGDGIFKTTNTGSVDVSTGSVDYNTINIGLDNVFHLQAANALSSATPGIKKVTVGRADQLQIFAGDGFGTTADGSGHAGGSLTDITVTATKPSDLVKPAIFLHAGDGATGTDGGAGGAISTFTDLASTSYVKLQTGDGGAAVGGHGGAGGSFSSSTISSSATKYEILVGNGGSGDTGGAGGSIKTVTFTDTVNGGTSLLATGDFNADGIQDVLIVNSITGNATLAAGTAMSTNAKEAAFQVVLHPATNPDGSTTTSPFIAPVGSVPTSLVAADLNGDGTLDFAVSYGSSDNIGIFLNNGAGVFAATSVALPASPTKIAVGDFMNTGHQDIAVLAGGSVPGIGGILSSQLYIAEADGHGAFPTISAPETFVGVATDFVSGQFDGTGGSDLAVGLKSGSVETFLANGSTTAAPFTVAATTSVFANGPISNLDLSGTTLLAFTVDSNGNIASGTTPAPAVLPLIQLYNVNTTGGLTAEVGFAPAESAPTAAHFIGSPGAIGVVDAASISIYTPSTTVSGNATYISSAAISSDGALNNFVSTAVGGSFQLTAVGASTSRFFTTAGTVNNVSGVGTLLPFDIPGEPYVTNFQTGSGGAGDTHDGGKAGSIHDFSYTQVVGAGVGQAGARFDVTLGTGDGGASNGGTGGKGGGIKKLTLSLDPADFTGEQDSTTLAVLSTGAGGAGFTGGRGGNMSAVTETTVLTQMTDGGVVPNSVALELLTGNGGSGVGGAGGNGGNISLSSTPALSGVSGFDPTSMTPFAPGLLVQSGNGGNGATTGGNGGILVNIRAQNAAIGTTVTNYNQLESASIVSGNGGLSGDGNGGNGGDITGLNLGVQSGTPAAHCWSPREPAAPRRTVSAATAAMFPNRPSRPWMAIPILRRRPILTRASAC